jgi:hypothetical protein
MRAELKRDLALFKRLYKPEDFHAGTVRSWDYANLLLCDFDQKRSPSYLRLCRCLRELGLTPVSVMYAPSSSGNWHVIVALNCNYPLLARLFAQLYVGSDPEREKANFIRVVHYGRRDRGAQILFEKKVAL